MDNCESCYCFDREISQGDAYPLPFEMRDCEDTAITDVMVKEVELLIGSVRKLYTNGDIYFADDTWYCVITQQDTFNLPFGRADCQVRVLFTDDSVVREGFEIDIARSRSKEVLSG